MYEGSRLPPAIGESSPLCWTYGLNGGNADAKHGDAFCLGERRNASRSLTFVHIENTVAGKSLNSLCAVATSRSGSKKCPRSL